MNRPIPTHCPICDSPRQRGSRQCSCGFEFSSAAGTSRPWRKVPDNLLGRLYAVLAVDVGATLLAVYLTASSQGAPPSALRDLLILVHIAAGTVNALLLHRLLMTSGGSRTGPIGLYMAGMVFCFPLQWVVLLYFVARWKAEAT